MSTQTLTDTLSLPLRRANDYLSDAKRTFEPEMLFDEFWREGELARMFGPSGSGKSILALQLADALARGTGFYGFRMPDWRRRVLYVDLRNTDRQFAARCSIHAVGNFPGRAHKFPRALFRDRPPAGLDLCQWLRAFVRQHRPQVVIIDDLTMVKTTHDGTLETLRTMRRLRELRDELGISILVLTDCQEPNPRRTIDETDLGRSRILCSVADSVFAVDRALKRADDHYLVQLRAREAVPFWTSKNAPTAKVVRRATGLLEFEFDERFSPTMHPDIRLLICTVVEMHEQEQKTFREIAAELGMSVSYAHKLYRRWTPAMERGLEEYEEEEQPAGHEQSSPPYQGGVAVPTSFVGADGVVFTPSSPPDVANDPAKNHPVGETPPPLLRKEGSSEAFAGHFAAAQGMDLSHDGPPYPVGSDGVRVEYAQSSAQLDVAPNGSPPVGADRVVLASSSPPNAASDQAKNHPVGETPTPLVPAAEPASVAASPQPGKEGSLGERIPFLAALRRRSIYDLERDVNGYGREIWVESRWNDGRPVVWYDFDSKGRKVRHTRGTWGIDLKTLDTGPYL